MATPIPGEVVDQLIGILSVAVRVWPGANSLKRDGAAEAEVRQSTDGGVTPWISDPLNPKIDLLAEVYVVRINGIPRKGQLGLVQQRRTKIMGIGEDHVSARMVTVVIEPSVTFL